MNDALIATLAAYGPCRFERLAELLRVRQGRLRRQLVALWEGDLVSVSTDARGSLYRLTARGQARAGMLRSNERRFAGMIRTRTARA